MEKSILWRKTNGREFNSSDEEKLPRRLKQSRIPAYICWLYKVPGQRDENGDKLPAAGPGVYSCDMPGEWVPF